MRELETLGDKGTLRWFFILRNPIIIVSLIFIFLTSTNAYSGAVLYQPFPENWPVWTPRDKLAEWLEHYAISQDLLVWTSSCALPNPSYDPNTRKWSVSIDKAGQIVTVQPQHLVVAIGMLGEPFMPGYTIDGHDLFQGQILHTNTFPGGRHFSGKRVVVVGTGNSGADVALDLSLHGAESVTIIQRSSTCVQPASTVGEALLRAWPPNVPTPVLDFRSLTKPLKQLVEFLAKTRGLIYEREKDLIEGLRNAGMQVDMGPNGAGVLPLVYQRFGGTLTRSWCCCISLTVCRIL